MKIIITVLLFSISSFASDCIPSGTGFEDVLKFKGLEAPNPGAFTKIFKNPISKMKEFRTKNCSATSPDVYDNCISQCENISIREMNGNDYRPVCRRACVLQKLIIEKNRAESSVKACEKKIDSIIQIEKDMRKKKDSANR